MVVRVIEAKEDKVTMADLIADLKKVQQGGLFRSYLYF